MTTPKKIKVPKAKPIPGSLLTPEMMGGITGGKGFDFQTRYAVCHLPLWLRHGHFHQLFYEGTGDIDIRFVENGHSIRQHVQVKDHDVTATELKEVVAHFAKLDAEHPDLYQRFTLACPSLAVGIRSIENGLSRLRNAKPFYDDAPSALTASRLDLSERLKNAGLEMHANFIETKVFIEVGHESMGHDDKALELFIARILEHPSYADRIRAMVEPAFAHLMQGLASSRGTVLERSALETMLASAITSGGTPEAGINLVVQNWTNEAFTPTPDYNLDWTEHFDRTTRRVPNSKVWDDKLVPELLAVKKDISSKREERLIRFRGKCALSTGFLLGATFPTVGGWTIEMAQPPAKELWRSDSKPAVPYKLEVDVHDNDSDGVDLVLGLNIKGDGREDILRFTKSGGPIPRAYVFISPSSQGGQAIAGDAEACAFAVGVAEHHGVLLKKYNIRRTRLFYFGPQALAVFLGQRMTSVGKVQLFEYQDPGYVSSCTIQT